MAKNLPIQYHRITGRHSEDPKRVLAEADRIVKAHPDNDNRFMLTDQTGDNINKAIGGSSYSSRVNSASRYDKKNLANGAKLRREAELKFGVKYHSLGENNKVKSGHDKYWSDRLKFLRETNPTPTYNKDSGKRLGKPTTATHNPKDLLLDEIGGTDNPEKFQAGLDFIQNSSDNWSAKQEAKAPIKKSIPYGGFRNSKTASGKNVGSLLTSSKGSDQFHYSESPEVIPYLNNNQNNKFEKLKGTKGYQDPAKTADWSDPEGTYITKDFDSKAIVPSANDFEHFSEKGGEAVDKMNFDPNSGPRQDDFDSLPLFDASQSNASDANVEYVDEHYTKTLELRQEAGRDPDRLKIKKLTPKAYKKLKGGLTKRYKNALAHGDKTARAFAKEGAPSKTAIVMERGKFDLGTSRSDARYETNNISKKEQARLSQVVDQATGNKPKVSSTKKVLSIRKKQSLSVKAPSTNKQVVSKSVVKIQKTSNYANPNRKLELADQKVNKAATFNKGSGKSIYLPKYSKTAKPISSVTPGLKLKSNAPPKNTHSGVGTKFTRGLGVFNILSSLLGIGRGMKEAKQDFNKMGVKRNPTALENLSYQFIPKNVLKRTRLPAYGKDS